VGAPTRGTPACTRLLNCGTHGGTSDPSFSVLRQSARAVLKGCSPASHASSNRSCGAAACSLPRTDITWVTGLTSSSPTYHLRKESQIMTATPRTDSSASLRLHQPLSPGSVRRKGEQKGAPQAAALHLLLDPDRCVLLEEIVVVPLDLHA